MLSLFDTLYNMPDSDLTRYLLPEEAENYAAASRYRAKLAQQLEKELSGEERSLWDRLQCNLRETEDTEAQLCFRRGLCLGLRLGQLASWV